MLPVFLSIPLLGILVMLQAAVISRIPLLYGTADVVLLTLVAWAINERVKSAWVWAIVAGLFTSVMSAMPNLVPLFGYLGTTAAALLLRKRIWQTPILTMLVITFLGTVMMHGLSLFALEFEGIQLPFSLVMNQITLPSALLNLLFALPVYALVSDLANGLYPPELEV